MVDVRFGNYEQFLRFFANAPRNVQQILYKAYPDFAARMTNDYMNATKKVTQATTKAKGKVSEAIKAIAQKPTNTSKPNPNLNDAFDTLYGKTKDVGNKAKNVKIPKLSIPKGISNLVKGAGRLTTAIAPAQGLVDMNTNKPGTLENARGATMFGSGALGLASGNPYLLALAGGLALGGGVAEPLGNAIGDWIYKPKDVVYNPDFTLLDTTQNLKGQPYTPEELQKVLAFNDAQNAKIAQQYGQAMVPFGANTQPQEAQEQSGNIPSNYSQPIPQGGIPVNTGVIPQSFQNAQEGGVNRYQDILLGNQIQPTLNPIVEPVNYSNLYQQRANQVINELGGIQPQTGEQQMVDINPYNQIRGYDMQAPIPQALDYQQILDQYKAAMDADARQNQVNQMINAFGAFGEPSKKAPIYYVGANGDLRAIELDQPNTMAPLPTNTTSNADKFAGQLAIQQAQQEQAAAQYKQYQDLLAAQQQRIDMENQANALAQRFGGDPAMYMNKDVINTLLKETINPNIQAQANIAETIGKAPTQAKLKQAEQLQAGANKLDEVALNQQYSAMIANINNNAKLLQTQLEQQNMNSREAAALATQWALGQMGQVQQNYRAMIEDARARDLAVYGRGTQESVANIYANARTAGKETNLDDNKIKMLVALYGAGYSRPEVLKAMQDVYPGFGSTPEEQIELNRLGR